MCMTLAREIPETIVLCWYQAAGLGQSKVGRHDGKARGINITTLLIAVRYKLGLVSSAEST